MRPGMHGNILKAILTVGVLIVCLLPNCSGSSQADTSRCIEVPREKLESIASGLTVSGGGSLRDGWGVKSEDFSNVYFIAAEIDGPGLEGDGDIGLWASNSLESGRGLTFSIDSTAKEFSDWGHGDTTDSNITQFDDGADEAKACVRACQEG